jgi:membrane protein DedA with SNARE-associated domain
LQAAAAGSILGDNADTGSVTATRIAAVLRYGRRIGLSETRIKVGHYLFRKHGGKVVFFGRFVALSRILAAFLAGVNRMPWRDFVVANAAGAVLWAGVFGVGAYYFGKLLFELHTMPAGIALAIAFGIFFGVGHLINRYERRLIEAAERALPGPLPSHAGTPRQIDRRPVAEFMQPLRPSPRCLRRVRPRILQVTMSYIAHSLGQSEHLIYRARFPWFYPALAWALLIGSVLGAVLIDVRWLGIGLLLAGLAACAPIMLPLWTTEIGVTNQRFIYKRGWLWRTTQELQLRAIEEVNLNQGLLGRLFDFGQLELRGTGVDDIRLPLLADPLGLRKALQDGMASAAQPAVVVPVAHQNEVAHSTA